MIFLKPSEIKTPYFTLSEVKSVLYYYIICNKKGLLMKKAVYAGSFDPVTNGHLWIIEQSSKIFDNVLVAVGQNADKNYTFSLDERLIMLRHATKKIDNVEITYFSNEFLVNYAQKVNAKFIIRGIRNNHDYDYEKSIRHINADLSEDINTIFLMPPRNYAEVSSSMVKGLIGSNGWEEIAKKYVPKEVLEQLIAHSK
jgi:pantetheine-phosphate adenylyltransferase